MLLLLACSTPEPAVTLSPDHGNAFGHYAVEVVGADATAVRVGGTNTYASDLGPFTLQGGPPGEQTVEIDTADGVVTTTFTYDDGPTGLYAVGASITMGSANAVATQDSQLASPVAMVAQQLGAWLPLPLVAEDLFPPMTDADLGPAPECAIPDLATVTTAAAAEALGKMRVDGEFSWAAGRVDATLVPHNVAVAGSSIHDIVDGPDASDFARNFLSHLVYEPTGDLTDPVSQTQLDLLGDAETILITDLYGNDVLAAVLDENMIDLAAAPPEEDIAAGIDAALAALPGEVWIANLPAPSVLPVSRDTIAQAVARGDDTEEHQLAQLAEVDALAARLNAHLAEVAPANVHVVDLASAVAALDGGVEVDGVVYTTEKLGGLVSLDGLHFTPMGNALAANTFLDAMGEPTIDLATIEPTTTTLDPAACLVR